MKSNILKIMSVILIVSMIVMNLSSVVLADADYLNPGGVKAEPTKAADNVAVVMNQVLGIVQVIAIGIAVIMLVVLAIKYISAAPSEKADIKKGLTTYIIGAILLFGATGLLQLIKTFTVNISGS